MPRLSLFLLISVVLHASAVLLLRDESLSSAAPLSGQGLVSQESIVFLLAPAPTPVAVAPKAIQPQARKVAVTPAKPRAEVAAVPALRSVVPVKSPPCLNCAPEPSKPKAAEQVASGQSAGPQATAAAAATIAAPKPVADVAPIEVLSKQPSFAQQPQPPQYPSIARRRNQQGVVLLEVRLDARGAQRELTLVRSSGISSLDQAALKAVAEWRFRPETRNGHGVPSRVQIPVEFALLASR